MAVRLLHDRRQDQLLKPGVLVALEIGLVLVRIVGVIEHEQRAGERAEPALPLRARHGNAGSCELRLDGGNHLLKAKVRVQVHKEHCAVAAPLVRLDERAHHVPREERCAQLGGLLSAADDGHPCLSAPEVWGVRRAEDERPAQLGGERGALRIAVALRGVVRCRVHHVDRRRRFWPLPRGVSHLHHAIDGGKHVVQRGRGVALHRLDQGVQVVRTEVGYAALVEAHRAVRDQHVRYARCDCAAVVCSPQHVVLGGRRQALEDIVVVA
eukprot:7388023-Prymnesium_polylepis.3